MWLCSNLSISSSSATSCPNNCGEGVACAVSGLTYWMGSGLLCIFFSICPPWINFRLSTRHYKCKLNNYFSKNVLQLKRLGCHWDRLDNLVSSLSNPKPSTCFSSPVHLTSLASFLAHPTTPHQQNLFCTVLFLVNINLIWSYFSVHPLVLLIFCASVSILNFLYGGSIKLHCILSYLIPVQRIT